MPPAPDVTEPDQLAVGGEQSEEDGEVLAVPGIVPAVEVGGDVVARRLLEGVERGVAHPVQRAVECLDVQPVGGVGDGCGDQGTRIGTARLGGRVLLLEGGPVGGGAFGVGGEEPAVVGIPELFVDMWPDVAAEVVWI
ncbi:hypothetical protein [Streptomyces brevispora]|uniref:Uncharacterized protein n=1 Tax=Streptomyces brevispora TaxID=887462 RepID=A0ABZ1GG50_9ACTN|nr:hypothetical protein [Streptomyces brevispora]WSC18151.1 hypothetical protein OIE64_30005 [Streptomyces brevispora]